VKFQDQKSSNFQDRTKPEAEAYGDELRLRYELSPAEEELRKEMGWTPEDMIVLREMQTQNHNLRGWGETRFPNDPRAAYHIDKDRREKLPPKTKRLEGDRYKSDL
jgi:hypothetical protein